MTGAVAEHARFRHQHNTIERRKRDDETLPDMSCLLDGPFDERRWSIYARLYYYYSLGEAHLYEKTISKPYRGLKRAYRTVVNTS